jgi:hypothetical protein
MDAASKKLIYKNVACGHSYEALARALDLTVEEVERTFRLGGLMIAQWMLEETVPYVPCQTPEAARANRKVVLQHLEGLNVDDKPRFARVRAARCAVES